MHLVSNIDNIIRINKKRVIIYFNNEKTAEFRRTGDAIFYKINPVINEITNFYYVNIKNEYLNNNTININKRLLLYRVKF